MSTCPLCEDPVLPDDATEVVLGMPCHAECAAAERSIAVASGSAR